MVFRRLFKRFFGSESTTIPTLYPNVDPIQLELFLTEEQYTRIKSFDNVYVLPFVKTDDDPIQMCFGLGLSRLMIRNLMLLRDISIHGPEDTAQIPFDSIHDILPLQPR